MYFENLIQRLKDCGARHVEYALYKLLRPILAKFQNVPLNNTYTLAIKAGGSPTVKNSGTIHAMSNGRVYYVANNTDMPALSGTVTNGSRNVFVFSSKEGTLYTHMGTEGSSIQDVVFPKISADHTIIGYIVVYPTGTGNFVGGTTPLDDATVVPNTLYVVTTTMFEPHTNHS